MCYPPADRYKTHAYSAPPKNHSPSARGNVTTSENDLRMACSEKQFQCELNGPGATKLVERAESALAKIASRQTPPQHLGGLTELRVIDVSYRGPEVGMVEDIEHLGPELQLDRFTNRKIPMASGIPLG